MEAFKLTKQQFESPLVYIFWLGNQCQYVGRSYVGMSRVAASWGKLRYEVDYSHIDVLPQESIEGAFELERELIYKLKPQHNIIGTVAHARIPKSQRTIKKDYDAATGLYLVVGTETEERLYSGYEMYKRDRFFAQESLRRANAKTQEIANQAKVKARQKEVQP